MYPDILTVIALPNDLEERTYVDRYIIVIFTYTLLVTHYQHYHHKAILLLEWIYGLEARALNRR